MSESTPQQVSQPSGPSRVRAWRRFGPVPIAFAVVAAAFAWLWFDTRSELGTLREQVAQRVRDSESESRDARLVARQSQEASREAQAKLSQLEVKLAESQNQQVALEAL